MVKISLSKAVKERYAAAHYGIVGNHSGVEICSWTKRALRGQGVCYKQKFYGIDCHRCAQISPALAFCQLGCIYCWRPMEWMRKIKMRKDEVDEPAKIIEGCVAARRRLISGIGGAHDVNKKLFAESFDLFPSHWAISLSGEPTLYPRLGEMIKLLRKQQEVRSIFVVTNGQEPGRLRELAKNGTLPTQLYVSVSASNEKLFNEINRPRKGASWARLLKTISLLPKLRCRRVIRLTLIKDLNDAEKTLPQYGKLLELTNADFVEVKGYTWLGYSRTRLKKENMPSHKYVKEWANKLATYLPSYNIIDEDVRSCIVLFKRNDSKYENVIVEAPRLR